MKMPKTPPELDPIWKSIDSPSDYLELLSRVPGPTVGDKYPHWDKLIRYKPPVGLSHEKWWLGLKIRRQGIAKSVPLKDNSGRDFTYSLCDPIPQHLHEIDQGAGGFIRMPGPITNPETRDQYYVNSLIEEAITSSVLEGAATTRRVARSMIRTGRKPRDRSEQMIMNNFRTMQRIGGIREQPMSIDLVLELHRLVTAGTLDDESAEGRFRRPDEAVVVDDMDGEIFHEPPPAQELRQRVSAMCRFANGEIPKSFVHPAIRAIILHFWLAYDHPFVDGNGRTARALFYWSMLHHGYWLFEFISISSIILKGPAKYGRAFLYTETDDNDLTYFILYHLDVIRRAIDVLHAYIARRTAEIQTIESELRGLSLLNHRQRSLLAHALRHPRQDYTIESHRLSHNVVYETARQDLLDLHERGLMNARKTGRTWHFTPVEHLEEAIRNLPS